MFKKGIMSLESIDFQDNSFLQDLTKAINKLRYLDHGLSNTKFFNSVELGGIISCIKKHTNLSVTFQPTEFGAAVYTPQISNNNVLVNNDTKDLFKAFDLDQEESILRLSQKLGQLELKGSVNLKTSKVDGVFKELESTMLVSRSFFNSSRYSDEEIAAVFLHEIGHIFTFIEYVTRSVTTNQCLSVLVKTLDKKYSSETKEIIFKNLSNKLKLTKEELDAALKTNNKNELTIIVLGAAVNSAKSELGNSLYDYTSAEYLADQFVARHGASIHLVTALEKLRVEGRIIAASSIIPIAIMLIITNIPLVAIGIGIGISLLLSLISKQATDIYDNDRSRIVRLKLQNTERLKNTNLSSVEKKYYLDENEAIDNILKSYSENKSLFEFIAYWSKPGYRKARDFEDLQKGLEKLSGNSLFEKAAKLSTL